MFFWYNYIFFIIIQIFWIIKFKLFIEILSISNYYLYNEKSRDFMIFLIREVRGKVYTLFKSFRIKKYIL